MFYDSSLIEEIKYRNGIYDIVSGYVSLKRSGSGYTGLCPFHSEKTPSFHVSPEREIFHCFGCGAGGDVITFIMRMENLDYPSAIEFLAKRAGITLPERSDNPNAVSRTRITEMNKAAARFFHDCFLKSPEAQAYIAKRGLGGAVIKHFGVGFAPDSPGALTAHLKSLGFTDREMTEGFLCGISRKTGRPYDYFRNRVIIPIIDTSGNIIAFGGRIIGEGEPKYLNSSDTPAFRKSKNLFALNFARKNTENGFILCEGYMDVIALHEFGFTQAVATLGTAITPEQARLMKRYTDKVIISYDSDNAGQNAAKRAFKLLGDAGLDCRILKMDGAKDPDEYIRKFGKERFSRLLTESVTPFDYVLDNIVAKYDITNDAFRIKAAEETTDYIASVYSAVERNIYIARVCEKLSLPPETVKSDVERKMRINAKREKENDFAKRVKKASGIGDRVNPEAFTNLGAASAEEVILGIVMLYPELISEAEKKCGLCAADFVTEFDRRVYEKVAELTKKGGFDTGMLAEFFTQDEIDRISRMQFARMSLTNNGTEVIEECIRRLRESQNKDKNLEDILNEKRKRNQH